ncbi:RDD family protein [Aporhodopirellula aestuarii]|uniref:RDD family protein n=1 Tax=Aporhodopirellula aestuarii TaxID=2950107 RepID=A0ABT0TY87_9BACT|nr:RDD family protein [Aporhodopirellula aestuarii]MCM2369546.1 RDD family protein [Aporhodopirellula aestuarii]
MQLKCPGCTRTLKIPDSAAGKVVKCPCGKQMRVPAAKPATAAVASAAPAQRRPAAAPAATRPAAPARAAAAPTARTAPVAAARPAPAPANAFGVDAGLFDELTDSDLKPVALPPKPGAMPTANKPTKGGTDDYVSSDDKNAMAINAARQKCELAPLPRRLGAYFFDGTLFFMAALVPRVLAMVLGMDITLEQEDVPLTNDDILLIVAVCGSVLVALGLTSLLISLRGQSVGKLIFGLVIVDAATIRPVGFHQGVLVRWIGWKLKCMIPFLGARYARKDMWSLFANEGITDHDMMAGTLVVTTRSIK